MAGLAMRGPVNVTLTVRAATRMAAAPAQKPAGAASGLHRLIVMPESAQASRRRSFEGGQPCMRWTGPPLQSANVKVRVQGQREVP